VVVTAKIRMKTATSSLLVSVEGKNALIKLEGRASFSSSVDFKTLVNRLAENGFSHFVLDLTDCVLMDSTFLGVLAGLGLNSSRNGHALPDIELFHPSQRIRELLDNLGVAHLFKVLNGDGCLSENMTEIDVQPTTPDRIETTRICKDAHELLMRLSPANVDKFKDVARFLAEDLKKMEQAREAEGQGKV
jgi:anti-sigma B factor antagonist